MQPDYLYKGRVIRIVDADTIDIEVDVGFYIKVNLRFRLADIDAFEVRGPEREQGLIAKAKVEEWLSQGGCYIQSIKTGKFGRWLAQVWTVDGLHINAKLVEEGHAKPYG